MKKRALLVKAGEKPKVIYIDSERQGEQLRKLVDGYLECIYPFADMVALIRNDEGKINGLPLNRGLYDEHNRLYDIIAGDFVIMGIEGDDFIGLTDEQVRYYKDYYMDKISFIEILEIMSR